MPPPPTSPTDEEGDDAPVQSTVAGSSENPPEDVRYFGGIIPYAIILYSSVILNYINKFLSVIPLKKLLCYFVQFDRVENRSTLKISKIVPLPSPHFFQFYPTSLFLEHADMLDMSLLHNCHSFFCITVRCLVLRGE